MIPNLIFGQHQISVLQCSCFSNSPLQNKQWLHLTAWSAHKKYMGQLKTSTRQAIMISYQLLKDMRR